MFCFFRIFCRFGPESTSIKNKLAVVVKDSSKALFSLATTLKWGCYSFSYLLHFNLDPYLIMLSVKQGGIKYHFLSLWYDSTLDWTPVIWAIGEHSTHEANKPVLFFEHLAVNISNIQQSMSLKDKLYTFFP